MMNTDGNLKKVDNDIKNNLMFIKNTYEKEKNFDFVIREFSVFSGNEKRDGFLIFYDGLVSAEIINRDILSPLMTLKTEEKIDENTVYKSLITQAPLSKADVFSQVIEMVGFGNCAVFIDNIPCAFIADVKGFGGRGIEKPVNEAVLLGPQEAFNEKIMTNIGLIRKILKDKNLIAEKITVGKRSKTPCALMYINGITNRELVREVRKRLSGIEVDYVYSSTDIEMFTEDSSFFPFPQILKTERPDRAASMLADGKVVVVVQGSPFVLVMPGTMVDLIEASEDNYVRVVESNFMRFVRLMGIYLSLFLPAGFIAAVLYHKETIPTELLFAIGATRESMPFPVIFELSIMILAFELIKEASIRIPGPTGSTLGIVGGLILGQAAVSAGIASPILIIVVSISGLGSFAVPSLSLSRALSVIRFFFVILAGLGGFLGISAGVFTGVVYLSSVTSFGVAFLSPIAPSKRWPKGKGIFILPIWKREKRPENLSTQRENKQPKVSMKWKFKR